MITKAVEDTDSAKEASSGPHRTFPAKPVTRSTTMLGTATELQVPSSPIYGCPRPPQTLPLLIAFRALIAS